MAKKELEPSPELFIKIMNRLRNEERILLIKKISILSVLLIGSIIAFIPAIKTTILEAQSSGFFQFSALLFSDFNTIKEYWQVFALTILQTIPALSIALCLAILLTALQSIRALSKNIKSISNIKHLVVN